MGDDMQNEKSQSVPSKLEYEMAINRLNEAIYKMRIVRQSATKRWSELQDIAKRYYESNPNLPRPPYYNYTNE